MTPGPDFWDALHDQRAEERDPARHDDPGYIHEADRLNDEAAAEQAHQQLLRRFPW